MRPSRDALLIYTAAFVRALTAGLVGVILAIYFGALGLGAATAGVIIGIGLGGAAVMTALVGYRADRIGRRYTLAALTVLTAAGLAGAAFATSALMLCVIAFFGMLNGMGRDRGPSGALEQAMLPETADATGRTWVLAWYNVVLDAGHALGALAAAIPTLLVAHYGLGATTAHRAAFIACACAVLTTALPYAFLSSRVEARANVSHDDIVRPDAETKRIITRLAMLFGIDSLGGGFLSSALIAYWFFQRYGLSEAQVAVLFFVARLLNAGSHVGAAWLARRFGLLNTMVFTHLPSSLLLMAAPLAPTGALASAFFLAREGLVEMDVPTRQSYVMAVVPPSRRTFASSVTNLTRTTGWAVGPAIAGVVMQHVVLAGPLFIGGALKIGYDIILYRSFKHVKPPEERPAGRST